MRYAQFFHKSTGYVAGSIPPRFMDSERKPIPACGSDSVLRMDGRHNIDRMAAVARAECRKRGFVGFTINSGESYTHSRTIRKLEIV